MPQELIRRMALQAAAFEENIRSVDDDLDNDAAEAIAIRANELLRESQLWAFLVSYNDDLTARDVMEILFDINE